MKLHLPSRLRQALLTCLASLASLAPATLATGALGYSLIPTAWAADEEENIVTIPEPNTLEWVSSEASGTYTVSGSGNIKLVSNGAAVNLRSSNLNCENLWLSGPQSQYALAVQNVLSGVTGTIYLDGTGLSASVAQTINANLSIGAVTNTGGKASGHVTSSALWLTANVIVNKALEIRANVEILTSQTFTVNSLTGSGDMKFCSYQASGSLVIVEDGKGYTGTLNFCPPKDNSNTTIKLGDSSHDNITLNAKGLTGSNGELILNGNTAAKVTISGNTGNATSLHLRSGVVLELLSGAAQQFTNSELHGVTLGKDSTLTLNTTSITGTLTSNGGTLVASGGVVDLSGTTLAGSGLRLELNIGGNATLKLADGIDLSNATMVLTGVDLNALSQTAEYQLLSSDSTYGGNLLDIIDQSYIKRDIILSYENGVLRATVADEPSAANLVWSKATLTWQEGDTETLWDSEDAGSYFRPMDNVSFDASALEEAMVVTVQGAVHAGSMTVSGGEVAFTGEGEISADSLTVEAGATAEFTGTGMKSFTGGVQVEENGRLVLKSLVLSSTTSTGGLDDWSGVVKGEGTVVLEDLGHALCGTASGAHYGVFVSLLSASEENSLGGLEIGAGTVVDVYTENCIVPYLPALKSLTVVDGGSLALSVDVLGNGAGKTLYLGGTGVGEAGLIKDNFTGFGFRGDSLKAALSIGSGAGTSTTNNGISATINWDIELLKGGATIFVMKDSRASGGNVTKLTATYNGNGETLTLIGGGTLELADSFTTAAKSTGAICVSDGVLSLAMDADHKDALQDYAVKLTAETGAMQLGGNSYTIKALGGEGEVSGSGTLEVSNAETTVAEDGSNSFSGVLGEEVLLKVKGGYQAVSGSSLAAAVGGTGTLDVSGVTGKVELTVSDTGSLTGLSLEAGDLVTVENGLLTLSGTNTLKLSEAMLAEATPDDIIHFVGDNGSLAGSLAIDLSGVLETIRNSVMTDGVDMLYHITNVSMADWQLSASADLLVLGLVMYGEADGNLRFSRLGVEDNGFLYESSGRRGENASVAGDNVYESELGRAWAVHVDDDMHIDLTESDITGFEDDGLMLRNLVGSRGDLVVEGKGSGVSKVTISNTLDQELLADVSRVTGVEIEDCLTFAGNITLSGTDLQIRHAVGMDGVETSKTDSVTQLHGSLTVSGGKLELTSGVLELCGESNSVDSGVEFNGSDGQLVINGGSAELGGKIDRKGGSTDMTSREHIRLVNAAVLELADDAAVGDIIIGDAAASVSGTVRVARSATMAGSRLQHVVLEVDGALTVSATMAPAGQEAWLLAGLEGGGSLTVVDALSTGAAAAAVAFTSAGTQDIAFEVAGRDRIFTGSLAAYSGTMRFTGSRYTQIFRGVTGGEGWSLANEYGGRVVLDLYADGTGPNALVMGALSMEENSDTTIMLDMMNGGSLHAQSLTIASGADVTIQQCGGTAVIDGQVGELRSLAELGISAADEDIADGVRWHLINVRNAVITESGDVLIVGDKYETYKTHSVNAATGASLMKELGSTSGRGGDLAAVDSALLGLIESGKNAQADRALAAVAGSSTAVLSQAAGADMERQLRSMRNRALSMTPPSGGEKGKEEAAASEMSFWINADANYSEQRATALRPGYKLNGWGGSVGMSLSLSEETSVGAALSAMYNDLESREADYLKGDLDTWYITGFAKMSSASWQHSFVCSLGQVSADMRRTVNYGTGSYTTHGSTDGFSLGAMYEVDYTIGNAESDVLWQPVANVTWRYSRLDGYTERGSNAALTVDNISSQTVVLGLGARMQAVVGENAVNRRSMLTARSMLKVDLGDRDGEAKVAFAENKHSRGRVRSAERSVVGVEMGVGVITPISQQSDLFSDVSAELWKDQVDFTLTVGWKVSF